MSDKAVWSCKIGYADGTELPDGADLPMRQMVGDAFEALTGGQADFIFSGWAARLDEAELAVVEHREPRRELTPWGLFDAVDKAVSNITALRLDSVELPAILRELEAAKGAAIERASA